MRTLAAIALLLCSCGDDGGGSTLIGSCEDHPLQTGLTAVQTGVSVDSFDCEILESAAKNGEPDPMLFKAIIYVESRFDYKSAGCSNLPCGQPAGWSTAESGCLGLMQIVPACSSSSPTIGRLPNGHPNMTTDMASGSFDTSIFNPKNNIELGVQALAGNRQEVEGLYPGCTVDEYSLMALSNYANHGSARGCTTINHTYIDPLLTAYRMYATAAGYKAHDY